MHVHTAIKVKGLDMIKSSLVLGVAALAVASGLALMLATLTNGIPGSPEMYESLYSGFGIGLGGIAIAVAPPGLSLKLAHFPHLRSVPR